MSQIIKYNPGAITPELIEKATPLELRAEILPAAQSAYLQGDQQGLEMLLKALAQEGHCRLVVAGDLSINYQVSHHHHHHYAAPEQKKRPAICARREAPAFDPTNLNHIAICFLIAMGFLAINRAVFTASIIDYYWLRPAPQIYYYGEPPNGNTY